MLGKAGSGRKRGPSRPSLALAVILTSICAHAAFAAPSTAEMEPYFQPFAATNNLSGSVLIQRGGSILFSKSYGYADRSRKVPNVPRTRFRVASLSILFTSTAVLRLIDEGKLSFDTHVSEIVAGVPNGDKITIRNLLDQNSNLPDSNDDLPNYDDLMKVHQTPESLVAAIRNLAPHGDPGGDSQREEHSGQNLLALIIERKTGLRFAQAMQRLVFEPFGMRDSGIDDDSPIVSSMAKGYLGSGSFGLKPAPTIHWSAKTGNGSAYSTVLDEAKWVREVVHGHLLSETSRKAILGEGAACGWEKIKSASLGETILFASGRGPGFSGVMEYLPNEDVVVMDLTNIETGANSTIIPQAALMAMGKPFRAFQHPSPAPSGSPDAAGDYVFGKDFYRPSATLKLISDSRGFTLAWPDHPEAGLLPLGNDQYMDRYYWTVATVIRDAGGQPIELEFGKFRGKRVASGSARKPTPLT